MAVGGKTWPRPTFPGARVRLQIYHQVPFNWMASSLKNSWRFGSQARLSEPETLTPSVTGGYSWGCCPRHRMGLSEVSTNCQPKCYFLPALPTSPALSPSGGVPSSSLLRVPNEYCCCCNSPAISLRNASPFSGKLWTLLLTQRMGSKIKLAYLAVGIIQIS